MRKKRVSLKSQVGFLCLAALVGLGSCSKDVQTPAPESAISKDESSMRTNPLPYIPSTEGILGQTANFAIAPEWFSTVTNQGISNYNYVFGDPSKAWTSPLQVVPGTSSFFTFIVSGDKATEYAKTTINGLTPGKKYKVTYKVSYANCQAYFSPDAPWLDPHMQVYIHGINKFNSSIKLIAHEEIDLSGKKNQWVTVSTIFTAEAKTHSFEVYPGAAVGDVLINLLVPKNALEQIN